MSVVEKVVTELVTELLGPRGRKGDKGDTGNVEGLDAVEASLLALIATKSAIGHGHTASDVTDFDAQVQSLITGKSDVGHTHTASDVTDFDAQVQTVVAALFDTAAGVFDNLDTFAEAIAAIQANEDALALLPKRHVVDVGDAVASSFNVTHNFATTDVLCQVFDKSTGETVITETTRANTNTVNVDFGSYVPALNEFRIVVIA